MNKKNEKVTNDEHGTKVEKRKSVILFIIVIILAIISGVSVLWYAFGNGNVIINNFTETLNKKTNTYESIKVDKAKPIVYEANYGNKKQEKIIENGYSSKAIVIPYINIESEDAKKANNELMELYEDIYSDFGAKDQGMTSVYESQYNYYENDNILSIVLRVTDSIVEGGSENSKLYVYNFNLNTSKFATLAEMAKACGFESENDVTSKVINWEKAQYDFEKANPDKVAGKMDGVAYGEYFIDSNKKLNFIYIAVAASRYYTNEIVEPDKDITNFYNISNIEDSNDNTNFISLDGTYKRENGNLKISNTTNNSFDFEIDASWNENIGAKKGTAIKTDDGVYKYEETMSIYNNTKYVIDFDIADVNGSKILVSEIYDKNIFEGSSPYCGANVTFDGTYIKSENNNTKEESNADNSKFISLDGTYKRENGNLKISNTTNNSFDFEIDASWNENIGAKKGIAIKTDDGVYKYEETMSVYNNTKYVIDFDIADVNGSKILVSEIYDKNIFEGSSPYCGANVTFDGTYIKSENNETRESDTNNSKFVSLNGTYKKENGNLVISNTTNSSFDFEMTASLNEKIVGIKGIAVKTDDGVYKYEEIMSNYNNEKYKIDFDIANTDGSKILISEVYNEEVFGGASPYCGANITFDGTYNKSNDNDSVKAKYKKTNGTLTILSETDDKITFEICASWNKNIGGVKGTATKTDDDVYRYNGVLKDYNNAKYVIDFEIASANKIMITEIYDEDVIGDTSPYCGNGVRLDGTYEK